MAARCPAMRRNNEQQPRPEPLIEDRFTIDSTIVSLAKRPDGTFVFIHSVGGLPPSPCDDADYDDSGMPLYDLGGSHFVAPPIIRGLMIPPPPSECVDVAALYERVRAYILAASDLSDPDYADVLTAFVFMTWIGGSMRVRPLIFILGEIGSGKSRLCDVLGRLCKRGFQTSLTTTFAGARNLIQTYAPTLVIDEAKINWRDENRMEWVRSLNSAVTGNGQILVADKERIGSLHSFDFSGPKVIASTKEWDDPGFNSRVFKIIMKTSTKFYPTALPHPDEDSTLLAIVSELHGLLYRPDIDPSPHVESAAAEIGEAGYQGRQRQVFAPFAAIIKAVCPARYAGYIDGLKAIERERLEEMGETLEGRIVAAVRTVRTRGRVEFEPMMIAEMLNADLVDARDPDRVKPERVGRRLKALGFVGRRSNGKRLYGIDDSGFAVLCKKYLPEELGSVGGGSAGDSVGSVLQKSL